MPAGLSSSRIRRRWVGDSAPSIDPARADRAHYEAMAEYSDRRLAGQEVDWDWWMERYFTILGVVDPHLAGRRLITGMGCGTRPSREWVRLSSS